MNKRLLFVDDDPMVLSGLRRALHGMRQAWEMNFVGSADAALQALEKDDYDAVVSDMRMPGMDGAQLLEQIKQRYPDVVRMILSGQSSREAIYRSIAPAHQFLSKPCDAQELTARLGQAFAMRDLLANQALVCWLRGKNMVAVELCSGEADQARGACLSTRAWALDRPPALFSTRPRRIGGISLNVQARPETIQGRGAGASVLPGGGLGQARCVRHRCER